MRSRSYIPIGAEVVDHQEARETCDAGATGAARVDSALRSLVDDDSAARLASTFQALSDPTRVRIISAILSEELCVCEIAQAVGASQSAVSHQLHALRAMRLVRSRRVGRHIFYRLDDRHIYDLFQQGLEHISHT